MTALKTRKAGDRVNLESDIFAKYLEKMVEVTESKPDRPSVESDESA